MYSKKPIMKEYLQERNKNEFVGGNNYYETGIKKLAGIKKAQKRAKKISLIAEGIELANAKKDFYNIYK